MARSLQTLRQYLAGWWLFDNNFRDSSANSNDGTPSSIEWKPTTRGMKPRINGIIGDIDCGKDVSLDVVNEISMCGWLKLCKSQGNIMRKVTGGAGYMLHISSNNRIALNSNEFDSTFSTDADSFPLHEWFHVVGTISTDGTAVIYINGQLSKSASLDILNTTSTASLVISNSSWLSGLYTDGEHDDFRLYATALTAPEVLALYNATSAEHGVQIAEVSRTWDLDDVVDSSGAVLSIGNTKESTTELKDLSGNLNHATINGPMPDEGLIRARRLDGVDDFLDCGNVGTVKTIEIFVKPTTVTEYFIDLNATATIDALAGTIRANNITSPTIFNDGVVSSTIVDNVWNHIIVSTASPVSASDFNIGKIASNYLDGLVGFVIAHIDELTASEKITRFNSLATLPTWGIKYTDYPNNVTTYTERLPYSSTIISAGEFKVDADILDCVAAGTITYRAAHNFDGAEYVKMKIGGVWYAGTGTITQGTVTVSIAQGSNKITIVASDGDVIDAIRIQFRAEV